MTPPKGPTEAPMTAAGDGPGPRSMGWIGAVAATFTAVVAVAVGIWDNVETRNHNRLSVLPYIALEHARSDSGSVTRAVVTMSNAGVGPAMLRELEIRFPTGGGRDSISAAWGAVAPLISRHGVQIQGWHDVDESTALGVQQTDTLLRVQAEGEGSGSRVQRVLDGLRLRLRYSSVYGDPNEATLGVPEL